MAIAKMRKISISVRSDLIDLVDNCVRDHKKPRVNRSAIIEQALLLYISHLQEKENELYFSRNAAQLNADAKSWLSIATKSAGYMLR